MPHDVPQSIFHHTLAGAQSDPLLAVIVRVVLLRNVPVGAVFLVDPLREVEVLFPGAAHHSPFAIDPASYVLSTIS